jgi:hypothetical protein
MKPCAMIGKAFAAMALLLVVSTGCQSDGGGGSAHVHGSFYYGVGFYDSWYYGPGYYPPTVVVPPPGERPDRPGSGPRPEHPIAKPSPSPRPMPSIPSAPRVSPRGGGRR